MHSRNTEKVLSIWEGPIVIIRGGVNNGISFR